MSNQPEPMRRPATTQPTCRARHGAITGSPRIATAPGGLGDGCRLHLTNDPNDKFAEGCQKPAKGASIDLVTFSSGPPPTALVADTDVAAVEYQTQATMVAPAHLPNGRVVPGTGRRYDMSGCSLLSVEGHQITGVHHYYDRALMREQLGLPASGAPVGAN